MSTRFSDSDKFEVNEMDVFEEGLEYELSSELDDLGNGEQGQTRQRNRSRRLRRERKSRPERKNKFGWAFFLCSMFIGLGITSTVDNPLPLFVGLGVGFLFFVDPIYQRLMDTLNGH